MPAAVLWLVQRKPWNRWSTSRTSPGEHAVITQIYRNLSQTNQATDYQELKLAATRDALTNVANRGELESQRGRLVLAATR